MSASIKKSIDFLTKLSVSRLREVPATTREQQLLLQIQSLQSQLTIQTTNVAFASSVSNSATACRTIESAILDVLADPAEGTAFASQLLQSLPSTSSRGFAASCWEHVLEGMLIKHKHQDSHKLLTKLYEKMELLRKHHIYCPSSVWKQHISLEGIEYLLHGIMHSCQVNCAQLLACLHRSLSPDNLRRYDSQSRHIVNLQQKLETVDLLLLVHTLSKEKVIHLSTRQQQIILLAHLSRHGPLEKVLEQLQDVNQPAPSASSSSSSSSIPVPFKSLVNETYQQFPMLFQPLLECESGWLDRLRALISTGADASVCYSPWNCSAIQMLLYRKSSISSRRVRNESKLVKATQLLLDHGATSVLNLQDQGTTVGRTNCINRRTALIQAAAGGYLKLCKVLLQAGADADHVDSSGQSMLDYLFYLKHSHLAAHRLASVQYTCMQLFHLVQEFRLHDLLTAELLEDCRHCPRCRFLLGCCIDSSSSESSEEEESDTNSGSEFEVENIEQIIMEGGEGEPGSIDMNGSMDINTATSNEAIQDAQMADVTEDVN